MDSFRAGLVRFDGALPKCDRLADRERDRSSISCIAAGKLTGGSGLSILKFVKKDEWKECGVPAEAVCGDDMY